MALRQDHQRGPLRGRGARPRVPTMPPAPAFQGTSVPVHTVSGVPARSSLSDPGRREGPRFPASSCCHSEASPFLGAQFCSHMHSHTHTHTRSPRSRGERGHSAQVRLAEDRQQCSCSLGRGRLSPRDHDSPVPPPPNLLASAWLFPQGLLRGLWCPWSKGPAEDERRRGEA